MRYLLPSILQDRMGCIPCSGKVKIRNGLCKLWSTTVSDAE
ncbi:unnamed protein product [Acanthoscelides obtectus]|uniref:Uncharacterized protein n=1 Tax=Acanthoscelides obtectus TaxID=200917 RepID=A0A9P0L9X8_ACAOB|nr:unnamed protein product [Acanthoscelides obtectus]CAK1662483.1 hypothetical protein AOBTE_LOCUS23166 [Acanthoscelides obtectus]